MKQGRPRIKTQRETIIAILWCCLAAIVAAAQSPFTLSGRSLDQNGASLAGVTITLKQSATNFAQATISNASGAFRFTNLVAGEYELTVSGASRHRLCAGLFFRDGISDVVEPCDGQKAAACAANRVGEKASRHDGAATQTITHVNA